jgi:hypothetical protein
MSFCLGVKRPECEADHSSPSSVEVKKQGKYTSSPPVCLHGVNGVTLLYLYFILLRYVIFKDFNKAEKGRVKNVSLEVDTAQYKILKIQFAKAHVKMLGNLKNTKYKSYLLKFVLSFL